MGQGAIYLIGVLRGRDTRQLARRQLLWTRRYHLRSGMPSQQEDLALSGSGDLL